jgi:hypothetical protein
MGNHRLLCAAAILFVGAGQAWDSGILSAEPWAIAAVGAAIVALAGAALLDAPRVPRIVIALAAIALLFAVRFASAAHLPELGLIGFFGGIVLLVLQPRMEPRLPVHG